MRDSRLRRLSAGRQEAVLSEHRAPENASLKLDASSAKSQAGSDGDARGAVNLDATTHSPSRELSWDAGDFCTATAGESIKRQVGKYSTSPLNIYSIRGAHSSARGLIVVARDT